MSKIEWTETTWNPTLGCSKAGRGCRNCYAIVQANIRQANPNPKIAGAYAGTVSEDGRNWSGQLNLLPERLTAPLHWEKPRTVFVDSMSDLFNEVVPSEFIDQVMVVMWATRHLHKYQVLTKRPERMRNYFRGWGVGIPEAGSLTGERWKRARDALMAQPGFPEKWRKEIDIPINLLHVPVVLPLPNVIAGFSAWDQESFDKGLAMLARTPLSARMVSLEPLLGPVNLRLALPFTERGRGGPIRGSGGLDWVIVGGESGSQARPMHPDWARGIRDQCVAAGVPFFFKQWGEFREWDARGPVTQVDNNSRKADLIERAATKPCWITLDGKVAHSRDEFEEEVPYRMLERVGKKAAGRLLDGRVWDEMPGILATEDTEAAEQSGSVGSVTSVAKGASA